MKYSKPYKEATLTQISQTFGVNPLPYQPRGHTGIDFVYKYGTFLVAPENVKISSIVKADSIREDLAPLSRGYGIEMQSISNPERIHLYWHCLPVFPVKVGDSVGQGEVVAQMGNSGFVFSNGQPVPVEIRTDAPYKGTHLHWEVKLNGNLVDPLKDLNWGIEIEYNTISVIRQIIQSISNLFKL